jgi:molybdate transport system regulatory protein
MPLKSALPAIAGGRRIDRLLLLEKVDELGSINAAAKALGITYKAAWEAVDALNNLSEQPVVARLIGGSGGGGTRLTPHGRQVLALFRDLEGDFRALLDAMGASRRKFDRFFQAQQLLRRWNMKTSARNQFLGKVAKVTRGAVNSEVVLDIGGGESLAAIITNESVDGLALAPGVEAYAMVKASWVIVTTDQSIRTSARNRLCGVVSRCVSGAVNGEVVIDLPGGKSVAAIVTNESIRNLDLKQGVRACALIKASHIILAVNN